MNNTKVNVNFEMIVGEDKYPSSIVLTVDLNAVLSIDHLEMACTNFLETLCTSEIKVLNVESVEEGVLDNLPLETTEDILVASIEDEYEERARQECR